ncbi:MAG: two-component system sensor histidine kinase NtrB [Variovorax sp.]|uniref:two-component system sensor histidine kinase NtrB n=1 Tax=Variovorax sp. TaxID=1871043 RepID=UPI0040384989
MAVDAADLAAPGAPPEPAYAPPPLPVPPYRRLVVGFARLRSLWQRWFLWLLLAILVLALLVTVVWLAGKHEVEQVQAALDRDTADAVTDLRSGLQRNAQSLRATQAPGPDRSHWPEAAAALLREHREWLRLEWRDARLRTLDAVDTPYRLHVLDPASRTAEQSDVSLACAAARKLGTPAYSPSHYVPLGGGGGMEVMELCVPMDTGGGFLVASYSLRDTLAELVGPTLTRGQEVAFTETDGTRLVAIGTARRVGTRVFTSQQLIDLPGAALMLRVDGWRSAPDLFPNVLTALVTAISIALVSVLVLLARDTRRRLRAERDLADSLAFRKAMEDSVITGLRARDLQGRITYVNPAFCEMTGYGADELLGKLPPYPYWHPDEVPRHWHHYDAMMSGQPALSGFESRLRHRDGREVITMVYTAPLIDADGGHAGWMSSVVDITEQKRAELRQRQNDEQLQHAQRLASLGEMASTLAHELNQPLMALSSFAGAAKAFAEQGNQALLASSLDETMAQARRSAEIVRRIRGFVRQRTAGTEDCAVAALAANALALLQGEMRQRQSRAEVRIPATLPPVRGDRVLLEQVLLNLLSNSLQAMQATPVERRVVELEAEVVEGRMEIRVLDRGTGIDDALAEQVFAPFFTTKPGGLGLGLNICRTIVEAHRGRLVFDHRPGGGTVFTLVLEIPSP